MVRFNQDRIKSLYYTQQKGCWKMKKNLLVMILAAMLITAANICYGSSFNLDGVYSNSLYNFSINYPITYESVYNPNALVELADTRSDCTMHIIVHDMRGSGIDSLSEREILNLLKQKNDIAISEGKIADMGMSVLYQGFLLTADHSHEIYLIDTVTRDRNGVEVFARNGSIYAGGYIYSITFMGNYAEKQSFDELSIHIIRSFMNY